jgi:hypothetical protein
MAFVEKFDLVSTALIKHCKECVTDAYNRYHTAGMFGTWLDMDADMEFGYGYEGAFKEHFGDLITPEIASTFFFAGKNIIYAIRTFMFIKENHFDMSELIKFVEHFVSEQLYEFTNDYDEHNVSSWLNDENEEGRADDNPN